MSSLEELRQANKSFKRVYEDIEIALAKARHDRWKAVANEVDDHLARVLRYFWSGERQEILEQLKRNWIVVLEQSRHSPGAEGLIENQVNAILADLVEKKLIAERVSDCFELTPEGVYWLLHEYPPTVRWWQRLIAKIPTKWQVAITTLSLVANVFGVIEGILRFMG